ncbi:MAG: PilW family protein [Clostridium sp.]
MDKKKKRLGFTLIELVATMAIVGILMTVVFSLFSSSSSMLTVAEVDNELQNESRMAVNLIEDDLKFGSKIKLENNLVENAEVKGKTIEFQRKDSAGILQIYRYKFEEDTKELKKYKVERTVSEGASETEVEMGTLSKNVEEFEVKYLDTKVFEINIKLAKNKSEYEYKSSIFPMNK